MAWRQNLGGSEQHLTRAAAAARTRTQRPGKHLAVRASELVVEPNFQILRRYRRPLLLRLEHTHRPPEDHVHRPTRLGSSRSLKLRIGINRNQPGALPLQGCLFQKGSRGGNPPRKNRNRSTPCLESLGWMRRVHGLNTVALGGGGGGDDRGAGFLDQLREPVGERPKSKDQPHAKQSSQSVSLASALVARIQPEISRR